MQNGLNIKFSNLNVLKDHESDQVRWKKLGEGIHLGNKMGNLGLDRHLR